MKIRLYKEHGGPGNGHFEWSKNIPSKSSLCGANKVFDVRRESKLFGLARPRSTEKGKRRKKINIWKGATMEELWASCTKGSESSR